MLDKKHYANGQAVHTLDGDTLTYFFKSGKLKAFGRYVEEQMQGEWKFYRESKGDGDLLWQIGNFADNQKHGSWKRYARSGEIEYDENFNHGKML